MVDILLASYNGEKYIADQIESILHQTYKDWILYIKDDCSTDNTAKIILEYEKKYKDKIKVILSNKPSGSAKNNFFSMLQYSKNEYIMTCDQDDVWLPNKIELTYKKMLDSEKKYLNLPILVHSDLKVVDKNLNIIYNSLFKQQNLDSKRDKLNNLLIQNIVTGCTVMVNRNLLNHIQKVPKHAIMHDWWMALIASSIGIIVTIESPTILYRQHGNNGVGAKNVKSLNYVLSMIKNKYIIRKSLDETYAQSGELLTLISDMNEKNRNIIKQYSSLYKSSKLKKLKIFISYNIWKKGLLKVIGQILFC